MSATIFNRTTVARLMLGGLAVAGTLMSLGLMMAAPAHAACSAALPTNKGTATMSVNFPAAGAYRVWVRLLAPSTTPSGVYVQIPDASVCGVMMGRAALPANQLVWVDYQNGNVSSKVNATVSAGTHQVVLAGLDDGVEVDRVIFLTDTGCTPVGDGSGCLVAATPTPTATATPTPTATPVPTPTPPVGDTQAPTVPGGLVTTGQTEASVALGWAASTDNVGVAGYRVKRNGALVGSATSTTYIDAGLAPGMAYSYTVQAYDAAGNQSSSSAPLTVTTKPALDTTPPTAPTDAAATATSPTSVAVRWTAATDNVGVTGYYVLRNGVTLALATGTSYTDTTAAAATVYSYVVKARDAAGNVGPASNAAGVTTPNPPDTQAPSVPGGLSAMAVSARQINLAWAASTDNVGVVGYRISRGGQVIGQVAGTSYGDTTVAAGTSYSYTVTAYDAAGKESAPSAPATATTPPADTLRSGGLNATYYNELDFGGGTLSRLDPTVDFRWASGAPATSIDANTFSVRWSGNIHVPSTGTYTFFTRSDDGVRLWVNGKLLIDNWTVHSVVEDKATIALTGGQQYDIRMEYFDNTGRAVSRLFWKGPGFSKQIVPAKSLYYRTTTN